MDQISKLNVSLIFSYEKKTLEKRCFSSLALEPFYMGDVAVKNGFDIQLYGLYARGISNFKVDKIRTSVDKLKV